MCDAAAACSLPASLMHVRQQSKGPNMSTTTTLPLDALVTVPRFQTTDGQALQTIPQLVRRNAAEAPEQTAFRTRSAAGEWAGQPWREVYRVVTEVAAGLIGL